MGMIDTPESFKEKAQEKVPEPVISVGFVQGAGSFGSGMVGMGVSGLIGAIGRKKANEKAGGLHKQNAVFGSNRQTALILTQDRIYAFAAKSGWGGMKFTDAIGQWERKDLTVQVETKSMTSRIVIDVASTGDHFEVEMVTGFGGAKYSEPFLAELSRPAA
jgi:hypothetical protein